MAADGVVACAAIKGDAHDTIFRSEGVSADGVMAITTIEGNGMNIVTFAAADDDKA